MNRLNKGEKSGSKIESFCRFGYLLLNSHAPDPRGMVI